MSVHEKTFDYVEVNPNVKYAVVLAGRVVYHKLIGVARADVHTLLQTIIRNVEQFVAEKKLYIEIIDLRESDFTRYMLDETETSNEVMRDEDGEKIAGHSIIIPPPTIMGSMYKNLFVKILNRVNNRTKWYSAKDLDAAIAIAEDILAENAL